MSAALQSPQKYYGGFFWIAAISLAVPFVVAFAAFDSVRPTTKPVPQPDASGVDHAIWDYLLKSYVAEGLVDYDGMGKDYLFRTYLKELAECNPDALKEQPERLALLINAYNAFVINGVITHKIDDSVMNFQSRGVEFFDLNEHILAGKTMSLNHLEHEVIRKIFKEPRVHVALVCAARSCPAIRAEAYTGPRLDAQLADQSYLFANDSRYVSLNDATGELRLSPILKWYGDDWSDSGGYLKWLQHRVADEQLRSALDKMLESEPAIQWNEYDWALNSQQTPGTKAASKPASFGSGSVPNE
ncbi:MAG: DUF547 domain-containing protein [Planctomycetaceae bacterium]|nr:DUF547 domain-containing protein [Planctomycetaceae bacterium]